MIPERSALVVGPGPVALGQGPVFQFTAARACRELRRMGWRVIVLEDNPATLMDLDGGEGDMFIEPAAPEVVERIVERSGAGIIWYSLGGKRAWNLAMRLGGEGWLDQMALETAGREEAALWLCGDRSMLRETLESRGMGGPAFRAVSGAREGQEAAESLGFPLVVRPYFSCGGWGTGLAFNIEEYPILLEKALRESLTGEVLVERALLGWKKFIALVLADGEGGSCVAGVVQQLEPLPKNDQDSVLIYPSPFLGGEELYALRETARETVRALELTGILEIKMAVHPDWTSLHVLDVNPWPWRTLPVLEIAMGEDLLRPFLRLQLGGSLERGYLELEDRAAAATLVSVPCNYTPEEGEGEDSPVLGCRSMGRRVFVRRDAADAIGDALSASRRTLGGTALGRGIIEILEIWGNRLIRGRAAAGSKGVKPHEAGEETGSPLCLSRAVEGDLSGGLLMLGGGDEGPGGGYETDANCYHAMMALKAVGERVALFTPDPNLSLLAASEADAVFIGELEEGEISRAAAMLEMGEAVVHFGGRRAMICAGGLRGRGLRIRGIGDLEGDLSSRALLERLGAAGLRVAPFRVSVGIEEGRKALAEATFPLMASVDNGDTAHRLVYTEAEAAEFVEAWQQVEILWRETGEEAHEIEVEAVATSAEGNLVLLWEQVDEPGICSTDGLAVYPPCYITTDKADMALDLASRALDILERRGNASMRIVLAGEEALIWDISCVPSPNLPFLSRATGIPLSSCGALALMGRSHGHAAREFGCSAVRAPTIPYSILASSDILASPQRRSTGTVLGLASEPGVALAKALWSEGLRPQPGGRAFLSVANREKRRALLLARELTASGFVLSATRGTARTLSAAGMEVEVVNKLREGRPNVLDLIRNGDVGLVVNIPRGRWPRSDGFYIRAASAEYGIPCVTNMEVALALARGIRFAHPGGWEVRPYLEYCRDEQSVGGG